MTDDDHEVQAIVAGTQYLLNRDEVRAGFAAAIAKAIEQSEAVRALIYASTSAESALPRLMDLLGIDHAQAIAVLDMQSRRLAALERGAVADEYEQATAEIAEYRLILASPDRQRSLVGTERGDFLAKHANHV